MSPALKFINQLKLDSELIKAYRQTRSLLKDNNFTEEEIKTITHMPHDVMSAYSNMRNMAKKIHGDLYKYGFTDHPEKLPEDVSEHLQNTFEKINQEYPLDDNTGYYGEEGPFGRPDKML